jgi:protein-S-isoprenylcysteine O-methyltransferase Ste14
MLKALSVIGFLAMASGFLGLLIMRSVLSPSPFVIALQVAALGLMIWARITFGRRSFHFAANPTAGGLVTTGPYRFIRHPIYTAVCLFVAAGAAAHLSWSTVLLSASVWIGAIARMYCEERLLLGRFREYRQYAATTSRMIPMCFRPDGLPVSPRSDTDSRPVGGILINKPRATIHTLTAESSGFVGFCLLHAVFLVAASNSL